MIDIANILRLASDGYDVRDIKTFTRVPVGAIKQVCKDAGVTLQPVSKRARPIEVVMKNPQKEAEIRYQAKKAAESQPESTLPRSKENPLHFARMWLGKRLVEKPSGYFLDNVPVNLTAILQAANRAAKRQGAQQLDYNPVWIQ